MDWAQYLYLVFLAIGCGAGVCVRRWVTATVMAINCGLTIYLSPDQLSIGITDILCATILIGFIGGVRANSIALLFAIMTPIYTLGLPPMVSFTIVDVLAYSQIIIMGGGGFGTLARIMHSNTIGRLRSLNIPSFSGKAYPKRHVEMHFESDKT